MVEQEMTTVPMERRPHCEKGMQQSDAESLSGFPGWELLLWSWLSSWMLRPQQPTVRKSSNLRELGKVPQGYQACLSPDP